jgi:hypothetical protein
LNLEEFRTEHGKLVWLRDDGLCQFTLHVYGVEKEASDCHHCSGRSMEKSLNETWLYRMLLTRSVHKAFHDGRIYNHKMVHALNRANGDPVNHSFIEDYIRTSEPTDVHEVSSRGVEHMCFGERREIVWYSKTGLCPYCLMWFVLSESHK